MTSQASRANVLPLTGMQNQQLIMGGLAGGAFTLAPMAAIGAAGLIGAARAYESKAMRNLLVKLSRAKKGSTREQELFNKILVRINAMIPKSDEKQVEEEEL